MASLKEIKDRIASVGGTLKITSAMKMVASAKLHRAQQAIGNLLPYEKRLHSMLSDLIALQTPEGEEGLGGLTAAREVRKVAVVAFASNSSLCGAFNSNVIRKASAVVDEYRSAGLDPSSLTVYSVGRKMAEVMRRRGYQSPADYASLSESPSYAAAAALAEELVDGFVSGRFDRVELVYNHFKSTASQPTVRETYLPFAVDSAAEASPEAAGQEAAAPADFILEPSAGQLLADLLPKVARLKVYSTLLDASAAEHAARTVAMQTATDNAEALLQELTLAYNKSRQQKITSEILDIVGGSL